VVLIRALALLLLASAIVPASAHKGHEKNAAERQVATAGANVAHPMSPAVHEAVEEDIARLESEAAKPPLERLLDWIGRLHPFAVHFPLALFPVAWVAVILARRRRAAPDDTVRALIIVAGAAGAAAALLGWINAGWSLTDSDPVFQAHRWLGTALGAAGAGLAIWSWRRADTMASRAMAWSLGFSTLALLVQGWLGAALIHGIDHLAW
jgi:uncharacterized membrane protein